VKFTELSFASAFTEALGEVTAWATGKTRLCICRCRTCTMRILTLIMTLPLNLTLP